MLITWDSRHGRRLQKAVGLCKDYGLTALSKRVYIGNVKKNDLPELQHRLRQLFMGKKDRLLLFMLLLCFLGRNAEMSMTWNDAAEKVLTEEKKPLHYKDLTDKILERKLVETEGKTPHLTLYASISVENKNRQEKGKTPRFTIERGEVSLVSHAESSARANLFKQVQSEREKVKSDLLKRLRQLSGGEFEGYLETLLIKLGYENVELRGGSTDEGIDLFCEMSQGINQVKTGVQAKCKQAQREVGPKDVRLLRDVLPKFKCSQGVLITTSKFNQDAYDAATEEGRQPIILIDGDKLAELAVEHEVGVKSQKITIHLLDEQFDLLKPTKRPKTS